MFWCSHCSSFDRWALFQLAPGSLTKPSLCVCVCVCACFSTSLFLLHVLRACLEVLAGELRTPLTEDRSSPLLGKVFLFGRACSFRRDTSGSVREEGDTHLASQISRINPGNPCGDRCRSQTSPSHPFFQHILYISIHVACIFCSIPKIGHFSKVPWRQLLGDVVRN